MKGPKRSFDTLLFFALLCVLGIGLLMIASAGVFYGEARFGDEYYFLKQQLIGLGAGMLFLLFFQFVDYHTWRRFVVPVFFIALVLLVLVFIPGFGTSVYGATRWVALGP
ncbi:MAG: FtsW/RodA/SpoVE family cell cycle protein, partial [Patescibacteria group bacterium]